MSPYRTPGEMPKGETPLKFPNIRWRLWCFVAQLATCVLGCGAIHDVWDRMPAHHGKLFAVGVLLVTAGFVRAVAAIGGGGP